MSDIEIMKDRQKMLQIYDGSLLFHYTRFENAIKILSSSSLLFGMVSNFNDVAERGKIILNEGLSDAEKIIVHDLFYRHYAISFTLDSAEQRGFALETQWGYYADSGKGVCIILREDGLRKTFERGFGKNALEFAPIEYIKQTTGFSFCDHGDWDSQKNRFSKEVIHDLFFQKNQNWTHEKEYRMLIFSDEYPVCLPLQKKDIVGVVTFCYAKSLDNVPRTIEYNALRRIVGKNRMFRLFDSLGKLTLINDNNQIVWPKEDCQLVELCDI